MTDILQAIASSPILALLGALLIAAFLLAPLILRVAGLTGRQIVDVLLTTARDFFTLIGMCREQNKRE